MRGTITAMVRGIITLCRGLQRLIRVKASADRYSLSSIVNGSFGFLRQLIRLSVSQKYSNYVPSIDRPPTPCDNGNRPVPWISPFHPTRQHPKHGENFEG